MDIAHRAGQLLAPHVVAALAATGHIHTRPTRHPTPRQGAAVAVGVAVAGPAEA